MRFNVAVNDREAAVQHIFDPGGREVRLEVDPVVLEVAVHGNLVTLGGDSGGDRRLEPGDGEVTPDTAERLAEGLLDAHVDLPVPAGSRPVLLKPVQVPLGQSGPSFRYLGPRDFATAEVVRVAPLGADSGPLSATAARQPDVTLQAQPEMSAKCA